MITIPLLERTFEIPHQLARDVHFCLYGSEVLNASFDKHEKFCQAASLLKMQVLEVADEDKIPLFYYMNVDAAQVTTLIYDMQDGDFYLRTLKQQTEILGSNDNSIVAMDEPFIFFTWKTGNFIAVQVDGLKEMIAQEGFPPLITYVNEGEKEKIIYQEDNF